MSTPEFVSLDLSSRSINETSHSNRSFLEMLTRSLQLPTKLTTSDLKRLLKSKPDEYVIIENPEKRSSDCWKMLGVPARVDQNGHHQPMENLKRLGRDRTGRLFGRPAELCLVVVEGEEALR